MDVTRIVAVGLCCICCVSTIGIIVVEASGHIASNTLVAIAAGSYGVLVGIPIHPTARKKDDANPPESSHRPDSSV